MNKEEYEALCDEVTALLGRYEGKKYTFGKGTDKETESILYFGDDTLREALLGVAAKAESLYEIDSQKRHYPIGGLFKLINDTGTVGHFSVHEERKFRHVANADKVAELLEKEVAVWANTRRKRLKGALKSNEITSSAYDEALRNLESEIERGKDNVEKLLEAYRPGNGKDKKDPDYIEGYFDGYEVRILSKEHAKYFGTLHYKEDSKQKKVHLSILAPNILIYKAEPRSDDIVDAFMRESQLQIGDIFAKKVP